MNGERQFEFQVLRISLKKRKKDSSFFPGKENFFEKFQFSSLGFFNILTSNWLSPFLFRILPSPKLSFNLQKIGIEKKTFKKNFSELKKNDVMMMAKKDFLTAKNNFCFFIVFLFFIESLVVNFRNGISKSMEKFLLMILSCQNAICLLVILRSKCLFFGLNWKKKLQKFFFRRNSMKTFPSTFCQFQLKFCFFRIQNCPYYLYFHIFRIFLIFPVFPGDKKLPIFKCKTQNFFD